MRYLCFIYILTLCNCSSSKQISGEVSLPNVCLISLYGASDIQYKQSIRDTKAGIDTLNQKDDSYELYKTIWEAHKKGVLKYPMLNINVGLDSIVGLYIEPNELFNKLRKYGIDEDFKGRLNKRVWIKFKGKHVYQNIFYTNEITEIRVKN